MKTLSDIAIITGCGTLITFDIDLPSVDEARAAFIAAGGSIDRGVIDCPTPEAALAGLEYLAAVHRQRKLEDEIEESRRFQVRYIDSLLERH